MLNTTKVSSYTFAILIAAGFVTLANSANYGRQRTPALRTSPSEVDESEYEPKSSASASSYVKSPNNDEYSSYSNSNSRGASSSYGSSSRAVDEANYAEEQAKSAKYAFASAVDDGIMDQSQVRQEVRDGLKVSGSYSYSDGFFKRTIKYEADEAGYRVVGEETEPIGAGPQVDLVNGKADVHTQVDGINTQYSISSQDINTMGGKEKQQLVKSN